MHRPEFIDNLDGNTLADAIARVLVGSVHNEGLGEPGARPSRLDIASAFFSPAGFAAIADALGGMERIRLMVGAEPPREARPPRRRLDEAPAQFEHRLLHEGLVELDAGLREERDRFPFTRSGRQALRRLIETLRSGRMEIRRYERAFLHAKAYIFAGSPDALEGAGVIAGSSNLTRSGVTKNLELNLGRYDGPIVGQANDWFERLWAEAVPFDLADLLAEVFADWTPFDIFLRTLYQLYGKEVEELERDDQGLPLTSFQKHGAARAFRLIRDIGGAIVADEVGLGKTFIAGEILKHYVESRHRCLLICPAQLRDSTWAKFRSNYFLQDVECLSYEELAIDRQIALSDPDRFQDKLQRPLSEYQLVVVDEAHNYRNPDTPTRAAVLRRLLWGQRRDVLLLTATPVNNSLWDIYHLIRFFVRQDAFLADRGILSIRERFDRAARENPAALSPDVLYPIIDATTVKRTRQFVKKHYGGDQITLPDGRVAPIVFPEPRPITVRYQLADPLPALFDLIEETLDPDLGDGSITFARYTPDMYRLAGVEGEAGDGAQIAATVGLLRSGLLKRFESSAFAFGKTLAKLITDHQRFLDALDRGRIVSTAFLHELATAAEESLDDLLEMSSESVPTDQFDVAALRSAVERDLGKLEGLHEAILEVTPERDPKLRAITAALERIAGESEEEAVSSLDARQKRKVLIFSFFADTVAYLRKELESEIAQRPGLAAYLGRVVAVSGSELIEADDVSRRRAVEGFAPISSEAIGAEDRYDILITTDVLAEGVNLQQARHIINYDVPWNPMRLVQRHGRIDRIGSEHKRVYLRTIFPAERLDDLLNLEQRILEKIAMAAASIGVASPVQGGARGGQVFSETREEIERLLREDPSLFEHGGTTGSGQTGEEYRQTLRKALVDSESRVHRMPLGIGSGMSKGGPQGVFFCAVVGDRTYLRFLPTEPDWRFAADSSAIQREIGTCLRLIECDETMPRRIPRELSDAVFELWEVARTDIYQAWMLETDPANLQPRVRPLNLRVAEFIRANRPSDDDGRAVNEALDILEAPWPMREERLLRHWFMDSAGEGAEKARMLVERIRESGLEPFNQPKLLPPIDASDIELVCWMGLLPANENVPQE